jgi:hypothetical protein
MRKLFIIAIAFIAASALGGCGNTPFAPPETAPAAAQENVPSPSLPTAKADARPEASDTGPTEAAPATPAPAEDGTVPVTIEIGGLTFPAMFYDNESAQALTDQMPFR